MSKEKMTVTDYSTDVVGDFVRCNQCDRIMLLPVGADRCPECECENGLMWVDDENQESSAEKLKAAGHEVMDGRDLDVWECHSEEILRTEFGIVMKPITKCAECGSTDVYLNAWVDPNNDNKYVMQVDDTYDGLCQCCGDVTILEEELFPVDVKEEQFNKWQRGEVSLYIVSYRYYDPEEERPGGGYDNGYYDVEEAKRAMRMAFEGGFADYDNAVFEACVRPFEPELTKRTEYADLQAVLDSFDYDDYPYTYSCDNIPVEKYDGGATCPDCGNLKFEVHKDRHFKRCCGCGRKISDSDNIDLLRCEECGSLNVEVKTSADANAGTPAAGDDYYEELCLECENKSLVRHSELMGTINNWFTNELEPDDAEVISGLEEDNFDSGEEFDAACNELWDARSDEAKIEIWKAITNRQE